ncbi:SCP2 domain-containing protein [Rhodospirillum rubrum]|uniref:SCP2 domain-containing protein n=1 Tax=Rhodospirillum rubrum (strain ATCC 11170 / ATH 1.1.1 / DSM 467 / LMG 4362 / NCIMB 8255 / S1) TaxID=269796 RepID=Q2RRB9_RHORT|nr:SCP2 sterol-binding domain-containing protein [Rhodospirillum rubrum]ABC23326.1 hypothetical protein Rru_A2526 [Rhodospirillum rubrum ATCC 11170]AEO49059.1 hypothetical protein F11_12975 [Rhodospirillum rubrum F11]MBK5954969.1 hypothetical protein [Rhodospirillum rubrum]QXG79299.1 SCP2 sterol-binding domain-containing protein [Rhodospirillum rubrum]HAQ01280.1 hypothetical protein [Rhodospirillum rubrum]
MTEMTGLTPLMIAGQLTRPLPFSVVQALTAPVFRHWTQVWGPALGNRLSGQTGCLSIRPVGWPVCVEISLFPADAADPKGRVEMSLATPETSLATAIISAAPEVLLDLMAAKDGPDGDGAFFSRALRMEGDTGLVMAFRYAMEDAGLNLETLARDVPAPLAKVIALLSGRLAPLHQRAMKDLERAQTLLFAPLRGDLARLTARVQRLEAAGPARRPRVVSKGDIAHG